jgi:hypothetical protein
VLQPQNNLYCGDSLFETSKLMLLHPAAELTALQLAVPSKTEEKQRLV